MFSQTVKALASLLPCVRAKTPVTRSLQPAQHVYSHWLLSMSVRLWKLWRVSLLGLETATPTECCASIHGLCSQSAKQGYAAV